GAALETTCGARLNERSGGRNAVEAPQRRLADSVSRNSVQWDCRRSQEAGQAGWSGPRRASRTACALRRSGAMHNIRRAAHNAGIVSVKAYWGTEARLGK